MQLSSDPQLPTLQEALSGIVWCEPQSYCGQLLPILRQKALFGSDLCALGLSEKIERLFVQMLTGSGAVRAVLEQTMRKD